MTRSPLSRLALTSLLLTACTAPSPNPADATGPTTLHGPDLGSLASADLADPTAAADLAPVSAPDLAQAPTPDLAPPLAPRPSFVAASDTVELTSATTLSLALPAGVAAADLLLAFVDAEEGDGSRSLSAPAGWTALGGYPIHNLASAHAPYLIPASESHGTWIYWRVIGASEPPSYAFAFASASHARGVLLAYRGADPVTPIHDKSGMGYYGTGGTNGFGSGNTTVSLGLEVQLVATSRTDHPTYTIVGSGPLLSQRVNSGEQPNGLNLVVYDEPVLFGFYDGPQIANKQSPSGISDGFCFSATSLVLQPK
jgi:hypothetical protein